MRTGAWLLVLGSLVAAVGPNLGFGSSAERGLVGPLFATVYVDEFAHTGIAAAQTSLGLLSLLLALLAAGFGAAILAKRWAVLGWAGAGTAAGLLGTAWLTYHYVYPLVPCSGLGFGVCDAGGGLIDGTWVQLNGVVWQACGALLALFGGIWAATAQPEYTGDERFLRGRLQWGGETVAETVLRQPAVLAIGERGDNSLQLAMAGVLRHELCTPVGQEIYRLDWPAGATGQVQCSGAVFEVAPATAQPARVLQRGDSAAIDFGHGLQLLVDFLQPQAGQLPAGEHTRNAALWASFAAVSAAVFVLFVVAATAPKPDDDLDREGLAAHQQSLIEVNIAIPEPPKPQETPVPSPKDSDSDAAKRAPDEAGITGRPDRDPRQVSKVPKVTAPLRDNVKVEEMGMVKALRSVAAMTGASGKVFSGETNEINSKMALPMAGGDDSLVIGHGTGVAFKGTGPGGGGPEGPAFIDGRADLPIGDGVGRKAQVAIGPKARPKAPGPMRTEPEHVSAGCDKGDIAKNVRLRSAQFRACYETQLLSKPELSGKLSVQFTIGSGGEVGGDKVTADTLQSAPVSDCVLRALRRIKFAAPEAGVCVVAWPFVFSAN